MPTSPPDPLVTVAELPRYGVPASFLEQFRPRTIEVKIETAGALGTMRIVWRPKGTDDYTNDPIPSDPGATWEFTIEDAFASLTFAAGSYVDETVYTIAVDGTVTNGAGAIAGVTAERFDMRSIAVLAATSEAHKLMADGITPPLTAWGDDVKMHAAGIAYEHLKFGRGFTANGAGVGDENVVLRAQNGRRFFADIGASGLPPHGITDSAPSEDGPIMHYPTGDTLEGW